MNAPCVLASHPPNRTRIDECHCVSTPTGSLVCCVTAPGLTWADSRTSIVYGPPPSFTFGRVTLAGAAPPTSAPRAAATGFPSAPSSVATYRQSREHASWKTVALVLDTVGGYVNVLAATVAPRPGQITMPRWAGSAAAVTAAADGFGRPPA